MKPLIEGHQRLNAEHTAYAAHEVGVPIVDALRDAGYGRLADVLEAEYPARAGKIDVERTARLRQLTPEQQTVIDALIDQLLGTTKKPGRKR